jgi:hypothetical protein
MISVPKLVADQVIDLSNRFSYDNMTFHSSSPAIVRNPENLDEYLVLARCLGPPIWRNLNQLLTLNRDFTVKETKIIDDGYVSGPHPNGGYEDVRLFVYNSQIYYLAVYLSKQNRVVVVSGIFNGSTFDRDHIKPTFKTEFRVEKNWSFVNYNSKLCVIYRWFPLQICDINFETHQLTLLEEKQTPNDFKIMCGSSCAVEYNNQYWFIVHYHKQRKYKEAFVVFDKQMNLIKYSEWFQLEEAREFVYGFMIEDDKFIIGHSRNNSATKLRIFSAEYIQSALKYKTPSG